MAKRVFFVVGEASGDLVAAWFYRLRKHDWGDVTVEGIVGDAMVAEGIVAYDRYESLNLTGLAEIILSVPAIVLYFFRLIRYLRAQRIAELVVVDFPGFNLQLIKWMKWFDRSLVVTYVAPPQLWCWGEWRINTLRTYVDDCIVMYPFECSWYAQRGMCVRWIGSPLQSRVGTYIQMSRKKKRLILLLVGSRGHEIRQFLPLFVAVAYRCWRDDPMVMFAIPLSGLRDKEIVDDYLTKTYERAFRDSVRVVVDRDEKYEVMAQACCALTKPGTVTLELAIHDVPMVIAFKTSRITYHLARLLVKVSYMGLPNLLLNRRCFDEYIQDSCSYDYLVKAIKKLYAAYEGQAPNYRRMLDDCAEIRDVLMKNEKRDGMGNAL